jgi:phosphate transport system substrate-binding protein
VEKTDFAGKIACYALVACLAIVVVASVCILGCQKPGGSEQATPANTEPSGTIRVSGAWALYPMMVKWAEEYQKLHPTIRVDVSAGGAGKGAADALAGLVEIGMISRNIKPEEVSQGAFFVPVVKDAVFPVISAQNPVIEQLKKKGLKQKQLIDLFINGATPTWGQLVGGPGKDKVQVYTRSDSCGAAETWAQYLGKKKQEELKGTGVYGDPGIAEAVRRDPVGIGYNNLNYAYDARTGNPVEGLFVLPIDVNENGVIDPEEILATKADAIKAVQSGKYPSPPARDLFLMTKTAFNGLAKDFVHWILTDGQKFVDEVGYIKLLDEQITDALKNLGF